MKNSLLYVLIMLLMIVSTHPSDTYRRKNVPKELAAGQSELPITNTVRPIAIFQKCENYIECETRSGERLRFRVKLVVNVKPNADEAEVSMEIYQGTKLITRRDLDFFW